MFGIIKRWDNVLENPWWDYPEISKSLTTFTNINDFLSFMPGWIKEKDCWKLVLPKPGLDKKLLKLSSKDTVMFLSYEKDNDNKDDHVVDEKFNYSWDFAQEIESKNIKAKYENGILVITVKTKEPTEPKTNIISID